MKVNHDKTKSLILNITKLLKAQIQTAKKYKADSDNILSDRLISQEYKNEQIEELRNAYLAKHSETKEKAENALNEILELELENEKILEFDVPEFSNTLAVINAAKGNLPSEVIESIKINFAGQYQTLLAIKSAFERYGVDLKKFGFEEYTISAGSAVKELIYQAQNIEQSETSTIVSLRKLFKDVIRFGEVRGINFSKSEKTLTADIDDEARKILTRKAMGLN